MRGLQIYLLVLAVSACLACHEDGLGGYEPNVTSEPDSISILPEIAEVMVGDTVRLTAWHNYPDGVKAHASVTYSASGGTITPEGVYTAGLEAGTYRVIAVHVAGSLADTSSVIISAPQPTLDQLVLTPRGVRLPAGGTQLFGAVGTWSDGSTSRPAVVYSATGGTIDSATGKYAAGAQPGSYYVIAAFGGKADTSSVTLTPQIAEVAIQPGTRIQPFVDQNAPGTHFVLKAGTHLRQVITPKDGMAFRGEPGAVLDGDNVTRFAFKGSAKAVQIRDLEITRYASDSILGAIQGYDANDWTLENLNVHHNAGYGANLRGRFMVLGGTFHHNGRLGIGVTQGSDAIIDGVELSYNNPAGRFDPLWEAGGIKISNSIDVSVLRCRVHNNVGPGIWFDGDDRGGTAAENVVTDNTHAGIMYEISQSGTINGNTVSRNGTTTSGVYGSGILVVSSSDVAVYGNVLAGNANGIIAHRAPRGSGAFGVHEVRNVWVHDNDIEQLWGASGMLDFIEDHALLRTLNNRFDGNRYDVRGNPTPFYTGSLTRTTILVWRAAGQDLHSTIYGP